MIGRAQGFTLIELLVVIAIIGLLSALILASLTTAHDKGVDAQIKSDLHTAVSQANIDFDSYPKSYGVLAFTHEPGSGNYTAGTGATGATGVSIFGAGASGDQIGQTAIINAIKQGGDAYVGSNGKSFFLAVSLTTISGAYWCVDSEGHAKQENTTPTSALYASFTCP